MSTPHPQDLPTSLPQRDELLLQRYLDDRLDPAQRAAFDARLAAEPALQRAAAAAQALRLGFAAARGAGPGHATGPSAGFTAGVLAAARQLPSRPQLERADLAAGAASFCRKLLLAAAIVAGLGALWQSGIVSRSATPHLQAAPSIEVEREIERLDGLLKSGAVPPRATEPRSK
jgi:anti-sigma factor RsiW